MIRFEHVTKIYKRNKVALKDINLTFDHTGMVFIVGESGSGKTTLLNLLGLLDQNTQGDIFFDSINFSKMRNSQKDRFRNQHIGIVFQDLNLIDELTIKENILLPAYLQSKTISNEEISNMMSSLNLHESLDDYPSNLSGGERQRIAITRSLTKETSIVIADEPTGSLDEMNALKVMSLLKTISSNRLVVVVTHQMSLAKQYGDRIISLEKGKVVDDTKVGKDNQKTIELNAIDIPRKYHLPFSISFKFARKWFTYQFGRMVFSLLTFFLTLTALLVALTINQFDSMDAMKNGLKQEGITYLKVQKTPVPHQSLSDSMFSYDEIDMLHTYFDESEYIETRYSQGISQTIRINGGSGSVENYTSITEEQIDLFRFELYGALPDDTSLETNVVITNRIAYQLNWLTEETYHDALSFQSIMDNHLLTVNFIQGNDTYKYDFTIKGILDTKYEFPDPLIDNSTYNFKFEHDLDYGLHSTLFFGQAVTDIILSIDKDHIGSIEPDKIVNNIYTLTRDNGYERALEFKQHFNPDDIQVISRLDYSLHLINEAKKTLIQVSLFLGVLFLVTAVVTFIGFIHNMIVNKNNSIRIMRSLGARYKDMNVIFLIQGVFIALTSTIVSTILAYITGIWINNGIAKNMYVLIPLVNPIIWLPIVIFAVTLLVAYLITSIELKHTFNKHKVIG